MGYSSEIDRLTLAQGLISGPGCMSASIWPGASGGAVFDTHNRVVGVIVSTAMDEARFSAGPFTISIPVRVPFVSYFAPVAPLIEWLRSRS